MRLLLAVLAAVLPAFPQRIQAKLDTNATKVNFALGDVMHSVHGVFALTNGDFWFDPTTAQAGGQLVVSAASGNSGSHGRDSRMHSNILQVDQYPKVTFTPDHIVGKVNMSGDSDFGLHGMLDIHGASHEVTMKVKSHIESDRLSVTADFDVPYVKWGMKNPSTFMLRVDDTVQIEIKSTGQISAAQ